MTQTVSRKQEHHLEHDALVRRYDEIYVEWRRQEAVVTATRDDLESGPGDDADHAVVLGTLDEQIHRAEELSHQLDDVREAIDRLQTGTYGRCERCGNEIPAERLELFPATTLCVNCKKLAER